MKACGRCRTEKSEVAFSRDKRSPGGRSRYCKACARDQRIHANDETTPEQRLQARLALREVAVRTCRDCGVEKPRAEFVQDKSRAGGMILQCLACRREKWIEKRHGMTVEAYDALQAERGDGCLDCGTTDLSAFYFTKATAERAARRTSQCRACTKRQKAQVYFARQTGQIPTEAVESQVCSSCRIDKPAGDFGVDHARISGIKVECRRCVWVRWLMTRYGLTEQEYETRRIAQGGSCAICGTNRTNGPLVVDHDHDTGTVRGLLCDNCNVGISRLQDNPDILLSAAAYLLLQTNLLIEKE